MKIKLLCTAGVLLIIVSCIVPFFYADSNIISILPMFNNPDIQGTSWVWTDIAVFAISIPIISVIILYLVHKEKKIPVLILTNLVLILGLFVLAAVWFFSLKNGEVKLIPGCGLLLFLGGYLLLIFSGRSLQSD